KKTIKLVLVGSGPELPFLQSLIAASGLADRIGIIPWVKRSDMHDLYSSSTVFFFPSHEGAGMVVPEALSCGLPVLCFDNAGPGEFITEDCGIKVPYRTYDLAIEDFPAALEHLYHDHAARERLKTGARNQFLNKFQWDQKGELLKQIYAGIA